MGAVLYESRKQLHVWIKKHCLAKRWERPNRQDLSLHGYGASGSTPLGIVTLKPWMDLRLVIIVECPNMAMAEQAAQPLRKPRVNAPSPSQAPGLHWCGCVGFNSP